MLRNSCQHVRTNFIRIVECEYEVWPTLSLHGAVRARPALDPPPDSFKRSEEQLGFDRWPNTHAATGKLI